MTMTTHAEKVAKLLQLIRQGSAEEVALLLEVAQWLRAHRDTLDASPEPGEIMGHALALLVAAGKGQG